MSKKEKIKNLYNNLIDSKVKKMAFITLSLGLIILLLFGLSRTNFVRNLLKLAGIYTQEEKIVEFYSDGWEENEPGAIHVTKSADWIAEDTAEITFDINSKIKTETTNVDVILAVDNSYKTDYELNNIVSELKKYTENILSDTNNRLALITFNNTSSIISDFTNDKTLLDEKIDNLISTGASDYRDALIDVDELLSSYTKEEDRDLIVFLITDGPSTYSTASTQYQVLKEKYPYMTINGISYGNSSYIIEDLKNTTDNQYAATNKNLNIILSENSLNPDYYESFVISDFIDPDFSVENKEAIIVPYGTVTLSTEKDVQKVTWTVPDNAYRTGTKTSITIKIKLDSKYVNTENYYATNQEESIIYNLKGEDSVTTSSKKTPVLKNGYKVVYDANPPTGCNISSIETETHNVFSDVSISNEEPTCEGYVFAGWEITTENVQIINNNKFIMPSGNVDIKGTWKKLSISKSMDGTVYEKPTLFEIVQSQSLGTDTLNNIDFSVAASDTNGKGVYTLSGTENDEYPVHYYRGDIDNNNVIFANLCWKIVRTTETGGVKLLYNGPITNGACDNSGTKTQITESSYSDIYGLASVGYMYGEAYSDDVTYKYRQNSQSSMAGKSYKYGKTISYSADSGYTITDAQTYSWDDNYNNLKGYYTYFSDATSSTYYVNYIYYATPNYAHYIQLQSGATISGDPLKQMTTENTNENSSLVKRTIDSWYESTMTNYTKYLEDTVWCNDRRFYDFLQSDEQWYYFDAYNRLKTQHKPTLECPNEIDRYTLNNSKAKLTYPVGMLTADEASYAGLIVNGSDAENYLRSGETYRTMTPARGSMSGGTMNFTIYSYGYLYDGYTTKGSDRGIRPAISLKENIHINDGDGSVKSPYIIDDGQNYKKYKITTSSDDIKTNYTESMKGVTVTVSTTTENRIVKTFKMNGELIEGDTFVMPASDVEITDVTLQEGYIIESEHNPYPTGLSAKVYGEKTFSGATSLNVKLDYETYSSWYGNISLYDVNGTEYGKYYGTPKKTETITIPGNYVKITFTTKYSYNDYYGFKAVITPNY